METLLLSIVKAKTKKLLFKSKVACSSSSRLDYYTLAKEVKGYMEYYFNLCLSITFLSFMCSKPVTFIKKHQRLLHCI